MNVEAEMDCRKERENKTKQTDRNCSGLTERSLMLQQ